MDKLYKIYNYPSGARFYQILKENDIKASHTQVKEFIAKQNVHQVLKPVFHHKTADQYIVGIAPNNQWQIDLLDYYKYSSANKGIKYILICVDIFTRKAYAEGIKLKTPEVCSEAFEKILKRAGNKPDSVYHDKGNEFKGKFDKLCESKHITSIQNDLGDHQALGIIDRFSRTLKSMIQRYLVANNTTKYIQELQDFVSLYNDTPHSSINDIKPNDATEEENMMIIGDINYKKQKHNQKIVKLKPSKIVVGDHVRYKIDKGTFTKGYSITYSNEVFTVVSIKGNKAVLSNNKEYRLGDLQIVPEGSFLLKTTAIEKADKIAKQKRFFAKEGLAFK